MTAGTGVYRSWFVGLAQLEIRFIRAGLVVRPTAEDAGAAHERRGRVQSIKM